MKGQYESPETILVIWYRPFSLFLGFFWSLTFAEVFRCVFRGDLDKTMSIVCFCLVVALFIFMGVYQHWLLKFAKEIGAESRNLMKCIVLGLVVSLGYAFIALWIIRELPVVASVPEWGAWVVGVTIAGWCGGGLGGMWYYHISPRQIDEKYGVKATH